MVFFFNAYWLKWHVCTDRGRLDYVSKPESECWWCLILYCNRKPVGRCRWLGELWAHVNCEKNVYKCQDCVIFLFAPLVALSQVSAHEFHQPHLALQCHSWAHRWVILKLLFKLIRLSYFSFLVQTTILLHRCPQFTSVIDMIGWWNDNHVITVCAI